MGSASNYCLLKTMPQIVEGIKLDFRDVLLQPRRSTVRSRADVDLVREYQFYHSKKTYSGIPVVASNMDTIGTFEMATTLASYKMFTTVHKHYTLEDWQKFRNDNLQDNSELFRHIAISSGIGAGDMGRLRAILDAIPELEYICLDVANGYSEAFVEQVRSIRDEFPRHTLIAGNVVTEEMVEELILNGADVVKVGIGPGSVCTTRKKAGVGYPQFSAALECAAAAHRLDGHIISDGGCTCAGDVAKAFGAGADFVMLGGMLAGHDQGGGEVIEQDGKKFKLFYGMASNTAMTKWHGQVAEYRASEGKTVTIPYRGDVRGTVQDVLGGIRSACTYVGARKLEQMPKRATFIRVQMQANEIYSAFEVN